MGGVQEVVMGIFEGYPDGVCLLFLPTCLLLSYVIYKVVDCFIRIFYISDIQNRYVMVTGCDTGFGRRLVEKLDKQGCHVFAGCLTQEGLEHVQKNSSSRIIPLLLDVTKSDSILEAFLKVKEHIPPGKGLWGLVNNAGIRGSLGPIEWLDRKDHQHVMEVNVFGMAEVIRVFLPLLKLTKGRVVNMASSLGRLAIPYSTSYSMSKFAAEGFSDAVRPELKMFGISVHILEPGAHKTNLIDSVLVIKQVNRTWDKQPDSIKDQYGEHYAEKLITLGTTFLSKLSSSNLDWVVGAYQHALFGRFPRGRYLLGWDAYLYVLISYMPEWASDLAFWLISPVPAAMCKRH